MGEIFPKSYPEEWKFLNGLVKKCSGRVTTFRNHSKVMLAQTKSNYYVIESSANVNTNPRTEQTVIFNDKGLFEFYREFYDPYLDGNNK